MVFRPLWASAAPLLYGLSVAVVGGCGNRNAGSGTGLGGGGASASDSGSPGGGGRPIGSGGGATGRDATGGGGGADANADASGRAGATSDAADASPGAAPSDAATDAIADVEPPPDPVIPLTNGTLKIEVWGERTLRVVYTTAASPALPPSLAVVSPRPKTPFTVAETPGEIAITTARVRAQVDTASGRVSFFDSTTGQLILAEAAANARALSAATVAGQATLQASQTFALSPGESLYGLGQHQQGRGTYNGARQVLQQQNKEIGVPVLVSSRGYGVLWDNPAVTTVDATSTSAVAWSSESAPAIDYYFMYGPEMDDVVADYRALTGAAPMLGRWAWGYWQSKEHYATQAEFLAVVHGYRDRQIPIDGIVQDWAYWQPAPWGSHSFDPTRYPDPAAMFGEAHTNHYHVLLSVWAKFEAASANYDALDAAGGLYPTFYQNIGQSTTQRSRYYDPFLAAGRALYWQQMQTELFAKGVDAWWLDATEPELGGAWGEYRTVPTGGGPGMRIYNAYPLMTTKAVSDGQRAATRDKRVFILTRSAYAGQQRNGAVSWSGDINGDFATFRAQIPAGIHFSLSGIPYWNTDIGGFFPQSAILSPTYQELYTRWFQYGAFCPMFRSHGTGGNKEMWVWGAAEQQILLGVDQLRYRLLPYIYSVSSMVTRQSYTMMRGLVFDFRSDPAALGIGDQFMFGPAFMVNPVTTAGATTRPVYLPGRGNWYDFWTGATVTGGQTLQASAPIDRLPLYVRAGSIVPLGPIMQYATEVPADPIEVRVYRGADGNFVFYEDENDNYNYENGAFATVTIAWSEANQTLTLGARQGSFPGMLAQRTFRIVFVGPNHGSGTAETATADQVVTYTGAAVSVRAP